MYTEIAKRKSGQRLVEEIGEVSHMRTDVLSSLLDSIETEGKLHLDESELVGAPIIFSLLSLLIPAIGFFAVKLGNMYVMLIAGHGRQGCLLLNLLRY